jgi:nucleotide-binding universal stress UspA family protein
MFRSLLVPLDGSEFSEQGLPFASRLARASGADIHLARVHVHAPGLMLASSPFPIGGVRDGIEQDDAYLSEVADRLTEEGMAADASVLEGPRVADSLSSYAEEVDADLVLMASHGRSGARRLWMGSVASDLVRRTDLPVFVTRPDLDGASRESIDVRNLLIVLDGSVAAENVLPPAAELAGATGARIVLVHAAASVWDEASDYLDEVATPLRERGFEVTTHAMFSMGTGAGIARVAAATGADVIALAIDGRGRLGKGPGRMMADEILESTSLPLLLVRSSATA